MKTIYLTVQWGKDLDKLSFVEYNNQIKEVLKQDPSVAYQYAETTGLMITGDVLEMFKDEVKNISKLSTGDLVTIEPDLLNLIRVMR